MFGFLLLLLLAFEAPAQDWPQWRGPNRDGILPVSTESLKQWPRSVKQVWKTSIGGGYSSPVLSQGAIYTIAREDENEVLSRVEWKTGKVAWRKSYPAPFQKNQYAVAHGKGPNSTPVVYQGRVYTLGITGILSSWNAATGELAWRTDYSPPVDTSKLFTGTAMSPVIDRELLIVHVGDDRGGEIIALNPVTGRQKWTWKGDGPGYASPIVAEFGGARQIITQTDRSIVGISTADGKLLWSMPWKDEWNENIVTPGVYDNLLILSGVRKPTQAIEINSAGGKWSPRQVWQNADISFYMNTPVVDGKFLYGMSTKRKGQFVCLDTKTGKTLWATTGREGENASVMNAGGHLVYLTTDGTLLVARANPKAFEMVSRYTVASSPTWAHPILADRAVLIKDSNSLALWRLQ
jgi:outer membrane protein assembly factor BamB